MRASLGLGALVVCFVGASGCKGGGIAPDDGGVPADGTVSTVAPATATAFCMQSDALNLAALEPCYGGTNADWPIFYGPSTCAMLDQAAADHRLTYNPSLAVACLGQLAKMTTCSTDWPEESCVASVLVGGVADGQPCNNSFECSKHSTCGFSNATDSCPIKACQHIPRVGEACDYSCQNGASCINSKCVASGKLGDPCGKDDQPACGQNMYCPIKDAVPFCKRAVEGGPCTDDTNGCFDYQYCDATKHCHQRLTVGGDCSFDAVSCQAFLACDPTTKRCVAASHPGQPCGTLIGYQFLCDGSCLQDEQGASQCVSAVADGGACAHAYECSSSFCGNGTCGPRPPNDGAACGDDTLCGSTTCSAVGICDVNGSDCGNAALCTSGLCAHGKCAAKSADGAACASADECTSGICAGDLCGAAVANGAACMVGTECASGFCSSGVCAVPVANGASCTDGPDCASGHCAAGKCAACSP